MEHYVRDCHRTRCGGLHQGSQASTFRAAQPPSRGGSQSGKCGSSSGPGGGREDSQSKKGHSHFMLFRVGQRLRLQMLLSQVLFRFIIDHLLYYLIRDLLILMCPHILLLAWIYYVSLLICRYVFLVLSGLCSCRSSVSIMYCFLDGI